MRYMLLIYEREAEWVNMTEAEQGKVFREHMQFTEEIQKSGKHLASAPLQPTATATTVRVRDGQRVTTDGPFAETREQLGGYYLVEAKDLDEAVAIAARIPESRTGSIEVRPVLEFEGEQQAAS
ncbi:MAG: YciI family protein [Luteitalea sp.]|nr:YciI family protein [Luteitalea sp.]